VRVFSEGGRELLFRYNDIVVGKGKPRRLNLFIERHGKGELFSGKRDLSFPQEVVTFSFKSDRPAEFAFLRRTVPFDEAGPSQG